MSPDKRVTRSGSVPSDTVTTKLELQQSGLGAAASPGSKTSARSHMPLAREPGDLGGRPSAMVGDEQPREGHKPQDAGGASEESDEVVVPKRVAKTRVTSVESLKGRTEAEGKAAARNAGSTQSEEPALTFLRRIRERIEKKSREKFTNLLSHLKSPLLEEGYYRLRRNAAPGVDNVTWAEYGVGLAARLQDLENRIQCESYYPQPVRRVLIPKEDGRMRPLGVLALEDKVVQEAVRMLIEPIYASIRRYVGLGRPNRRSACSHDKIQGTG